MIKPMRTLWKRALCDLALTGACLCAFALFHHVLPRAGGEPLAIIGESAAGETNAAASVAPVASPVATQTSNRAKGGKSASRGSQTVSGEKGGAAAEDVSIQTDAPTSAEAVDLRAKWAAFFTDEVVSTDTGYASPDIRIAVSDATLATDDGAVVCHVADVYLADVTCLQTALAQGVYGTGYRASIPDMAAQNGALLAINGDYYGNTSEGVVIRNGVAYRANATDCDVCVLYRNGVMATIPGASFDLDEAVANGAWQAWTFGPALLTADGHSVSSFSATRRLASVNPRTAIGYYEPGHYCFVTVDGRGESAGATLAQLSALMESLGCASAYNLDGGNSSVMVFGGQTVNQPSGGGRDSSDCILVKEAGAL